VDLSLSWSRRRAGRWSHPRPCLRWQGSTPACS